MEVVGAFWCQEWSGFFLALLSGILGVVVRADVLSNPDPGRNHADDSAGDFSFRGRYLQGRRGPGSPVRRLGLAVAQRRDRRRPRRHDLAGAPMSGLTIIGVLVVIILIFRGVSWLMVGFGLKRIPVSVA
jgi:hypothetical protein